MVTISRFTVQRYSNDEVRPLWDSKEVSYPNFIRVEVILDGKFEDAIGFSNIHHVKWFASTYSAYKFLANFTIGTCI